MLQYKTHLQSTCRQGTMLHPCVPRMQAWDKARVPQKEAREWGATSGTGAGIIGTSISPFVFTLIQVLLMPFFGRFMCPLAVAGLGFKYFVTNFSERLGHPFKKPFRMAFRRDKILGLHST